MGRHSALGPIDPQVMGVPAHAIVEEFERARREISANPANVAVWQPIIAKYTPTLVGECEKAIAWSNEMVTSWLRSGMFANLTEEQASKKIDDVMQAFGDHALNKSHARHIGAEKAQDAGVVVTRIEDDQEFQERLLTVHHTFVQTASETGIIKIVENHNGVAHAMQAQLAIQVPAIPQLPQMAQLQQLVGEIHPQPPSPDGASA